MKMFKYKIGKGFCYFNFSGLCTVTQRHTFGVYNHKEHSCSLRIVKKL